jgi:hypothetical protein
MPECLNAPCQPSITVSDANIEAGSISTAKLAPGPLPEGVKVTNDNVDQGSLLVEKLTCSASSTVGLSCAKVLFIRPPARPHCPRRPACMPCVTANAFPQPF